MKSVLKMTTAAAALAGSTLFCAPANAAYVGIGVGPVGFDIYSGGYCDRWGCPSDYWTYPIFYGPIYYDNVWYRGPVYYRTVDGERWYWIHGAWHRDQWRGARPSWARAYRYGPPLGLDYYRAHGFRVRDEDWRAWEDRDYRYHTGYRDYEQGGYYGNEDRDRYRGYDMDRDQYRDYDRDRYDERDRDRDRGYDRDYDRDRGTYEHSGYDRDRYNEGRDENGPDYDRDRGYDSDRDRAMYEHSNYEHSGGASGTGHATHGGTHTTHHTAHHTSGSSPDRSDDQTRDHGNSGPTDEDRSENDNGYKHTSYERPGSPGHPKGPPPSNTHRSTRSHGTSNPDDESKVPSD